MEVVSRVHAPLLNGQFHELHDFIVAKHRERVKVFSPTLQKKCPFFVEHDQSPTMSRIATLQQNCVSVLWR